MAYCSKCGVKLEESLKICPLCKYPIPKDLLSESEHRFPLAKTSYAERLRKRKLRVGIVTSFVFVLLMLTMFFSNLRSSHHLTWAKSTDISLFLAWIAIMILLTYKKGKEYWFSTKYFILMIVFFILLDIKEGVLNISITFEISLVIFLYVFVLVALYLYKKLGLKNIFLLIAIYSIMAQILLFYIDFSVGIFLGQEIHLSFSIYTLIPLIGVCVLSLYFHHDMAEEIKESVKRKLHF